MENRVEKNVFDLLYKNKMGIKDANLLYDIEGLDYLKKIDYIKHECSEVFFDEYYIKKTMRSNNHRKQNSNSDNLFFGDLFYDNEKGVTLYFDKVFLRRILDPVKFFSMDINFYPGHDPYKSRESYEGIYKSNVLKKYELFNFLTDDHLLKFFNKSENINEKNLRLLLEAFSDLPDDCMYVIYNYFLDILYAKPKYHKSNDKYEFEEAFNNLSFDIASSKNIFKVLMYDSSGKIDKRFMSYFCKEYFLESNIRNDVVINYDKLNDEEFEVAKNADKKYINRFFKHNNRSGKDIRYKAGLMSSYNILENIGKFILELGNKNHISKDVLYVIKYHTSFLDYIFTNVGLKNYCNKDTENLYNSIQQSSLYDNDEIKQLVQKVLGTYKEDIGVKNRTSTKFSILNYLDNDDDLFAINAALPYGEARYHQPVVNLSFLEDVAFPNIIKKMYSKNEDRTKCLIKLIRHRTTPDTLIQIIRTGLEISDVDNNIPSEKYQVKLDNLVDPSNVIECLKNIKERNYDKDQQETIKKLLCYIQDLLVYYIFNTKTKGITTIEKVVGVSHKKNSKLYNLIISAIADSIEDISDIDKYSIKYNMYKDTKPFEDSYDCIMIYTDGNTGYQKYSSKEILSRENTKWFTLFLKLILKNEMSLPETLDDKKFNVDFSKYATSNMPVKTFIDMIINCYLYDNEMAYNKSRILDLVYITESRVFFKNAIKQIALNSFTEDSPINRYSITLQNLFFKYLLFEVDTLNDALFNLYGYRLSSGDYKFKQLFGYRYTEISKYIKNFKDMINNKSYKPVYRASETVKDYYTNQLLSPLSNDNRQSIIDFALERKLSKKYS